MKPIVDEDLCIGCGNCEDECPEVYRLEDDGLSHVIMDDVPADMYGCARDGASSCPVDAISFEE